jgi:hypothetical protein
MSAFTFAQKGITFKVQDVAISKTALKEELLDSLLKNFSPTIEAQYKTSDSLVFIGKRSFFEGLYEAYAHHRPFILSPDMIWLLISQGFAHHVNLHAEQLRDKFVNFEGKRYLYIKNDSLVKGDPKSPWYSVPPAFVDQISGNILDSNLTNTLVSDFSTTTVNERVASQIAIMETFKSYFNYSVISVTCGIPEITLEGTTDDWKKVQSKAEKLKGYQADWWIEKVLPVLDTIVKTSEGKSVGNFWSNILFETVLPIPKGAICVGPRDFFNGWILKFYPYDNEGGRLSLDKLPIDDLQLLPAELVKVNFDWIVQSSGGEQWAKTPMNFCAGFLGLHQNRNTMALRPEIGWYVSYGDTEIAKNRSVSSDSGFIYNDVAEFPAEILILKKIKKLTINFRELISIPPSIANMTIGTLELNGWYIEDSEVKKLRNLLPNTILIINGARILSY